MLLQKEKLSNKNNNRAENSRSAQRGVFERHITDLRVQQKKSAEVKTDSFSGDIRIQCGPVKSTPHHVIQRTILLPPYRTPSANAAQILSSCRIKGDFQKYANNYHIILRDDEFLAYIDKMIASPIQYQASSYKHLSVIICKFIYDKITPKFEPTAGPFSFKPFSAGDMKEEVPSISPREIYAPVSPVVLSDDTRRLFRGPQRIDFHFSDTDTSYNVYGRGRFMPQAGTYEELLKDESVVGEINKLFDGQIKVSTNTTANTLYALIVAVEGCARSAHNIALATIFFRNYEQIKAVCPDKSLFKLAEKFLSFVSDGGSSKSKSYAKNPDELRMLIAHCENNGIAINEKAISKHLTKLTHCILNNAGIHIDEKD